MTGVFCSPLADTWACHAQEQAKEARPGETIYKGHHSYDLMRQLQLGILFSIAKTPELRAQMQAGGQPSTADFNYQARLARESCTAWGSA